VPSGLFLALMSSKPIDTIVTLVAAAQRGCAHLHLEPARLGGVTDDAGSDTHQLPQRIDAEDGNATTSAVTETSTHITRL
jgi:hypothetical protein